MEFVSTYLFLKWSMFSILKSLFHLNFKTCTIIGNKNFLFLKKDNQSILLNTFKQITFYEHSVLFKLKFERIISDLLKHL